MALRELPSALRQIVSKNLRPTTTIHAAQSFRRHASGKAATIQEAADDFQELESQSALTSSEFPPEAVEGWDPVKKSQGRTRELPPSRYDTNASHC